MKAANIRREEEAVAARGARWIAVAMVSVGLSNYAYALLLTHLLSAAEYSKFAAGQGLILWAMNVATVSVPWVLAQSLARARHPAERRSAIRFAKLTSFGSGLLAGILVGAIASQFASSSTAVVLAVSTLLLFMGTTTTGALQGQGRMSSLAVLYVVENMVKNGTGIFLVLAAGMGETGALAAFGIGALVMIVRSPKTPPGIHGYRRGIISGGYSWPRVALIAGAQGLVSLFIAVDAVTVALLPVSPEAAASYQASATLSRVPLYIAGALATAFFPSLSKSDALAGREIIARALRMYAAVALPVALILATAPGSLLTVVFPAQYGAAMGVLLRYTAITGVAAGGIGLVTSYFQATDDYKCLRWLGGGLVAYVLALLVGWRIEGITGLALGGSIGAVLTLLMMSFRLASGRGWGVFARIALLTPLVSAMVLVLLHRYPYVWLTFACLIGIQSVVGFVRPGARHRRQPGWEGLTFARRKGRRAGWNAAVGGKLAPPPRHRQESTMRTALEVDSHRLAHRESGDLPAAWETFPV